MPNYIVDSTTAMASTPADRPTPSSNPEIEVTPEMIGAGVSEFVGYDSGVDTPQDAVLRIYLAMRSVERR
jgi:hypothetical protein